MVHHKPVCMTDRPIHSARCVPRKITVINTVTNHKGKGQYVDFTTTLWIYNMDINVGNETCFC